MKVVIFVLLLGFSQITSANTIFGPITCTTWVKDRSGPSSDWDVDVYYLNGYLNAMSNNIPIVDTKGNNFDPLGHLDSADQAWAWVDQYCSNHPLDRVSDAAQVLYNQVLLQK